MTAGRRASRREYLKAVSAHRFEFFGGLLLVLVASVVVLGVLDRLLPDGIATPLGLGFLGVGLGLVLQRFERRRLH